MLSETTYQLPISAKLETRTNWLVYMNGDIPEDPKYSFEIPEPAPGDGPIALRIKEFDAVVVRDDFLSIRTPDEAFLFFRKYGPWQVKEPLAMTAEPFKWSQVRSMRESFEEGLLSSRPGIRGGSEFREIMDNMWMWQDLPLELPFSEPLEARARCEDVQSALRASVYLSRLAGSQWARCAKTDCRKVFELKSKRKQLYCSPEHANIQSTRNSIARLESARKAAALKTKKKPAKK